MSSKFRDVYRESAKNAVLIFSRQVEYCIIIQIEMCETYKNKRLKKIKKAIENCDKDAKKKVKKKRFDSQIERQ